MHLFNAKRSFESNLGNQREGQAMRIEYIQCDVCEKKHDAQYLLPSEWIRTIQNTRYEIEEEHHFCSKACLIIWASKDEGAKP